MTENAETNVPAIEAHALSKRYKSQDAVDHIDLSISPGSIYALLGPNGAGKTTTLKLLMGIIDPTGGESRVFGQNSNRLNTRAYQKIGYVSESQKTPGSMTLSQLIQFLRPYYPTWDPAFADKLLNDYELPLDKKLKSMSRGMLMKTKLLTSLVYHPEVLVLDEPFSGLDPVIREECIDGILDWAQDGERTAIISSHDIEDVERLADSVGIIEQGKLELDEDVESLKQRVRRVTVAIAENAEIPRSLPSGWKRVRSQLRAIEFFETEFHSEDSERVIRAILPGVERIEFEAMSLREIYVALVKQNRKENGGRNGS